MKIAGVLLIVAGILMFVFKGFNFTKQEKVVDIGPIEINKEKKQHVGWPIYAGGIALVAGIVLVVVGKKEES